MLAVEINMKVSLLLNAKQPQNRYACVLVMWCVCFILLYCFSGGVVALCLSTVDKENYAEAGLSLFFEP